MKRMNRTSIAACIALVTTLVAVVLTACLTSQRTYVGCRADQMFCNGTCTDVLSDPNNCGGCANGADAPFLLDAGDAGTSLTDGGTSSHICSMEGGIGCYNGVCTVTCTGGRTGCGVLCVDTRVDPDNCGGCGKACTGGGYCVDSGCQLECAAQLTACPAGYQTPVGDGGTQIVPVDASTTDASTFSPVIYAPALTSLCSTLTDDLNCGGCGWRCATGYRCNSAGVCVTSCPPPTISCSGQCIDPTQDQNNCGACGNACRTTQRCSTGICCNLPLIGCPANNDAGVACVNTSSDNTNCGACGTSCYGIGSDYCYQGACQ